MLIKDCDSREYDLLVLEVLAQDAALAAPQRHRVLEALRAIRVRQARRRALASQLDDLLGGRDDWVVLHDVRLAQDACVIEIDHLLINSLMQVWVLDASCFDQTLSITAFGELLVHSARNGQGEAQEPSAQDFSVDRSSAQAPSTHDGIITHAMRPCPLQTMPERRRAILQWLEDSALLPVRLGMTLQPQLRYRIVVADAAQVSRPPEDIVDSRALLSFARLKRQCLKVSSKTAYVTRLRSFTHRLDQRQLRQLGRAIAGRHVTPDTDWVAELELTADTGVTDGDSPPQVSALDYLWEPPALSEGQPQASVAPDVGESGAQDAVLALESDMASTAVLRRQRGFEGRGLQAAHWQPGGQGLDQGLNKGLEHAPSQDQDREPGGPQAPGESSDCQQLGAAGAAFDNAQGMSPTRRQDEEGLPRCQGCRRWLSSESLDFCRQAEQAQALGGRLLCKRCRDAACQ